jgi:hypothetical protein
MNGPGRDIHAGPGGNVMPPILGDAVRGAEAIAAILDYDERQSKEQQDRLIRRCYVWATALQAQAASDAGTMALPIHENGRAFTGNPALPAYASGSDLATSQSGMPA